MKNLNFGGIVSVLFIFFSNPLQASRLSCERVFSELILAQSDQLGFTQNFIGHKWANHKISKIYKDYNQWKKGVNSYSRSGYILVNTLKNPLLAIRDVEGKIRLIDDHHKFYALSAFQGFRSKPFKLYFRLIQDYTLINPVSGRFWTSQEMITDLLEKNHLVLLNTHNTITEVFMEFPTHISEMPDLPTRSLMSFLLSSFELPLKGSDFKPMIQFLLAQKMNSEDIEPFVGEPFNERNIFRLRDEVKKSRSIIEFLMNNLSSDRSTKRQEAVREYLRSLIEKL